ncbi:amidohydrolase family protein [Mycolicibacterium sp.]|uniref:amidohydrolase family protein n=1 Tax=Mycolicibacterium sp. TaxID=2320850 RepID=UPI0037CA94EA
MCADNHVTAVDVHAHAMPLRLLEWLAQRDLADLSRSADGIVVLDPSVSGVGKGTPLPLARSQYDPASRLQEMDDAGVSIHAVSMPPFLYCSNSEDRQLVSTVIAHGNDELAAYTAAGGDRLCGLGSVPLGLPGAADEARRCLDELGLAGIAIGTRGAGKDLDDPVNDELWALLAERNTFVFLHPSGVPDVHRQRDFYLPQLVGYPMETALAIARMIFGKVFERHDLNLCLAHGGGCLPWLRGRFDLGWERKDVAHTTDLKPSEFCKRLYYDTAVFDPTLLSHLVSDMGADHVLLGTDHPFELGDRHPVETVRALGLDDRDTEAILWRTAAALLGLPVASTPTPGR